MGGTNVNTDVRNLSKGKGQPTVVVATPGRLLDHLRNTSIHGKPFPSLLQQVQVLVLDEADQLLEVRPPPSPGHTHAAHVRPLMFSRECEIFLRAGGAL